ncbi:MAG: 30S ribosome-binding factor RbfA [Candidatus Omnitrophica bacterium]|nr:30S ribosome-binding factor RbfA [Candidatus Omnitrophota bacterium]
MARARHERVTESVRKEVSELLQHEVKDVRIGFTTVTRVEMSEDLRHAIVFCSILGTDKEKRDSMVGLNRAKGFMRREIGRRLKLRFTPDIHFRLDTALDHSFHVEEVLRKIKSEDGGAGGGEMRDEGRGTLDVGRERKGEG